MTLLVVGEAITAFMRTVDHFDALDPFAGPIPSGAPMIFASVAGRLGDHVVPVAAVGDDVFGAQLRAELAAHGCDVGMLAVRPALPTTVAFVSQHRSEGTRRFGFYVDGTATVDLRPDEAVAAARGATWLHVSGSALTFGGTLPAAVEAAVATVKAAGGSISVDPNVRAETASDDRLAAVRRVVEVADVVTPSSRELGALGLTVDGLVAAGATVVSTDGAGQVEIRSRDVRCLVTPPAVEEINPDGAGDAFAAGLVVGLRHGLDVERAAKLGCTVAAAGVATTTPMGGAVSTADLERARR